MTMKSDVFMDKTRYGAAIAFWFLIFYGILWSASPFSDLEISLKSNVSSQTQFFFVGSDGAISEGFSYTTKINQGRGTIKSPLPPLIKWIRWDPSNGRGEFHIDSINVRILHFDIPVSLTSLTKLSEIDSLTLLPDGAVISTQMNAQDPSLRITLPFESIFRIQTLGTAALALFLLAVALLIQAWIKRMWPGFKERRDTVWCTVCKYTSQLGRFRIVMILLAALCLRLWYLSVSGLPSDISALGAIWPDEQTYFRIGQYLSTNGLIKFLLSEQSVAVAIANPMYLSLLYEISESLNVIRILNIFLSVTTIFFIYKIGKEICNEKVGLIAALLCTVHSQLISYSPTLLTEPIFLLSFVASIYFLIRVLGTRTAGEYALFTIAAGSLLTIGILTRSVIALLPVFLIAGLGLASIVHIRRGSSLSLLRLKKLLPALLLPIIFVNIVAAKNYYVFDRFTIAAGAGAALWLGSRPDTEGDEPPYRGRSYGERAITKGATHLSLEGDALLMEEAKRNIATNSLQYFYWSIKKVGRLAVGNHFSWFFPYKNFTAWYHSDSKNLFRLIITLFQLALSCSICVYGVVGMTGLSRRKATHLLVIFSAAYLVLISIPFLVISRYGLPLVMLLTIPTALAFSASESLPRGVQKIKTLGPYLVGIIALYILISA